MFTVKQIAAFKYLIFKATDVTELAKRVLAFLIDQSEGLTKEVCISLVEKRDGFTAEEIRSIVDGIASTQSSNGTTHLNQVLAAMGSGRSISRHYGDFDPARGERPLDTAGIFAGASESQVADPRQVIKGMPLRYTFWLAKEYYSRSAQIVAVTREELDQIDLDPDLQIREVVL